MDRMMAELFAKETGYCHGKGGSMHIVDMGLGILGSNGIVGAGIPIASGAGTAIKIRDTDQVVACHFGDGASNTGAFHEGINLAGVWQLPVIFVIENNLYAQFTPQRMHTKVVDLSLRGQGYDIPGADRGRQRRAGGRGSGARGHRPRSAPARARPSWSARPSAGSATPSTTRAPTSAATRTKSTPGSRRTPFRVSRKRSERAWHRHRGGLGGHSAGRGSGAGARRSSSPRRARRPSPRTRCCTSTATCRRGVSCERS